MALLSFPGSALVVHARPRHTGQSTLFLGTGNLPQTLAVSPEMRRAAQPVSRAAMRPPKPEHLCLPENSQYKKYNKITVKKKHSKRCIKFITHFIICIFFSEQAEPSLCSSPILAWRCQLRQVHMCVCSTFLVLTSQHVSFFPAASGHTEDPSVACRKVSGKARNKTSVCVLPSP